MGRGKTLLGVLGLALGLFATGCRATPELQGAEIATPPGTRPVLRATAVTPPSPTTAAAEPADSVQEDGSPQAGFDLQSSAFNPGEAIPTLFSCDGENVSPELVWGIPPGGTASYALIMDDPDAPGGTWVHWVIYNIPPGTIGLPMGVPAQAELPDGSRQGINSGRGVGYVGPCPPGETHRYFFKLFALDRDLELASGATADELSAAMQGHILGQAELMGTYTRD